MKISLCYGIFENKNLEYHLYKAKEYGFHGVEYYRWWNLDIDKIIRIVDKLDIPVNSICAKYISLLDPSKSEEFVKGLKETIEVACKFRSTSIVLNVGMHNPVYTIAQQEEALISTLSKCIPMIEGKGICLELEPLNNIIDHPSYFLWSSKQANSIINKIGHSQIKMCFDFYHQQISEGNVTNNYTNYYKNINHIHFADVPGRTEIGLGELNYHNILRQIVLSGFHNYLGLECKNLRCEEEGIMSFIHNYLDPNNIQIGGNKECNYI